MKRYAILTVFGLLLPLAPACAHPAKRPAVSRSLSAAPFTETTAASASPVSDVANEKVPRTPYDEIASAVSDAALRGDVRKLLLELARDGSNPELRIQLGERLLDAGHPALAIGPLRDAFYLRPGRAGIAALLTRAYIGAEKFSEALELAKRMVTESPDESGRWLFLAEVQRRSGNQQQALEAASRALLINPSANEAKAVLGFIYADQGQVPLARKLLTEVLDKPGVEVPALEHRLGRLEMEDENWQGALDHLNECLRGAPKMAAALNDRGVVYARIGRWEEAKADFSAAIEIAPGLAEAQVNHANMRIEEGGRTDANAALAAARREGTDPGAFYIAAGRLYALDASTPTGRANALLYLRRAQEHAPAETRKALERAVIKIESLPPPKPAPKTPEPGEQGKDSKPAAKEAPAVLQPIIPKAMRPPETAAPRSPSTTSSPAAANPVRGMTDESATQPDQTEWFRPAVD